MPIYTYLCPLCNKKQDLLRPAEDRDILPFCPHCKQCGEPAIECKRIFSVGNLGIQIH